MMVVMAMRKYADDYETIITEDEDGREKKTIVYRGEYFEIALDTEGLFRFKRISLSLLAIVIIFHVSGGFVSNRGMYQLYVALPYALAFFPLLYLAEGILRLPKEKRKYRSDEIGHSFDRMRTSSYFLLAFLGVGLLGEIVFLFFAADKPQRVSDAFYFAMEMVVFAALYILINLQKKIRIQPGSEADQLKTP